VPTPETIRAWSSGQPLPPLEDRFLHLRLPKIWEIGGIASIAERQLQGILDGEPLKAQADSLRVIANLFGFEYLPQFAAPFYEMATNKDRFTGRPIETQAMQELEPFARSNAYTSSTVRALGEATRPLPPSLQLSPAKVEHLLRGLFNTWALYGLAITDKAFFPGKPDSRTDQLPVVRRFFRQEPAQSTRYVEDLYEAIDAATKARNTARFMVKTYRPEIGQEMAQGEDVQLYSQLNNADERMRGFRKMSEAVTGAPDLEATQRLASQWALSSSNKQLLNQARGIWSDQGALKRLIIDDITRERNAYAEAVMGSVNQRREQMRAGQ
jgi:hypothetical protein